MSLTDTYQLANGTKIPVIGFGTWQSADGDEAYHAVLDALNAGYRHIDTAAAYGNEDSVGKAIKDSGVDRDELFVTTKLWNADHGYDATKKALETSLAKLGLDYVNLYLIHWANPVAFRDNWEEMNAGSWRAMEEAYDAGKTKAIGVSNFRPKHLDALLKTAKVTPMVNQLFINPSDLEPEVVAYNDAHHILTEAYSPFGTGKLVKNEGITAIAEKYGKSVPQLILRWQLQHGFLPLPKSVHTQYIQANTEIFDFNLAHTDMTQLDEAFKGVAGYAQDPDTARF